MKKTEKDHVRVIDRHAQSRGLRAARKSDAAKSDLCGAITTLRSLVDQVAIGGHVCHRLRRELTAGQRQVMLDMGGIAPSGKFEEPQLALLEETERLRDVLSDLAIFPESTKALHLMMVLRAEGKDQEHDPDLGWGLWHKSKDACRAIADLMFEWGKLSRFCELSDLPRAMLTDAPDLVAAAAAQVIPSEERINSIVATGTTCVALLNDFCNYRGISTE